MNKNKIITGLTIVSLAAAGTLAYAADSTSSNTKSGATKTVTTKNENGRNFGIQRGEKGERGGMMGEGRGMGMGMGKMTQLTDEEKTKLQSMTEDQKKAFFETKIAEQKAKIEAHEAVIDKLLNGQTLTDAEKKIVEEIKTERAKMKEERATREKEHAENQAKMEARQALITKVKAGQTLTVDEQKQLAEEFGNRNGNGKGQKIHQTTTTKSSTTTTK